MNIVKHLSGSSSPPLPKRRFQYWIKGYMPVLLFSSLLGTYLDLMMIGKHLYSFPVRPFPEIFSINLLFTLIGLPVSTLIFLILIKKRKGWESGGIIILFSSGMAVIEKYAESLGLFAHTHMWSHLYTFIGYCLFLFIVLRFHLWINRK